MPGDVDERALFKVWWCKRRLCLVGTFSEIHSRKKRPQKSCNNSSTNRKRFKCKLYSSEVEVQKLKLESSGFYVCRRRREMAVSSTLKELSVGHGGWLYMLRCSADRRVLPYIRRVGIVFSASDTGQIV